MVIAMGSQTHAQMAAEELGIDISRPERGTDEDDARREREKRERASY